MKRTPAFRLPCDRCGEMYAVQSILTSALCDNCFDCLRIMNKGIGRPWGASRMIGDVELIEAIEPYPSELPKIKHAFERLQREFANTPMSSSSQRHLELAARNLFGEAGFEIFLEWKELADLDGNQLGVTVPSITLMNRVKPEEETDHDRMAHEIRHGLVDGKVGVIREDGTFREDERKKIIT